MACPAVVITKPTDDGDGGRQAYPEAPTGRYHSGMGAYIGDRKLYKAVKKACVVKGGAREPHPPDWLSRDPVLGTIYFCFFA
ncbi:hypothetical protein EJB05_22241, partial [Eragrostis curvula]